MYVVTVKTTAHPDYTTVIVAHRKGQATTRAIMGYPYKLNCASVEYDVTVVCDGLGELIEAAEAEGFDGAEEAAIQYLKDKGIMHAELDTYCQSLNDASASMELNPDLEPRSALKQAASDNGIEYGADMCHFVHWAEHHMYA